MVDLKNLFGNWQYRLLNNWHSVMTQCGCGTAAALTVMLC
jgi:hypothetical protein